MTVSLSEVRKDKDFETINPIKSNSQAYTILKIPRYRWVRTSSRFHTEDPQPLGATVKI
jgi:hypothetical protein